MFKAKNRNILLRGHYSAAISGTLYFRQFSSSIVIDSARISANYSAKQLVLEAVRQPALTFNVDNHCWESTHRRIGRYISEIIANHQSSVVPVRSTRISQSSRTSSSQRFVRPLNLTAYTPIILCLKKIPTTSRQLYSPTTTVITSHTLSHAKIHKRKRMMLCRMNPYLTI